MENKHIKRCSTSYVNRELQIKAAMIYHCIPIRMCVCVHLVAQSCQSLCGHMDCSLPGSSVFEILRTRIVGEIIPFSRGSSWPKDWTHISHIAGKFFTIWATREAPPEHKFKLLTAPRDLEQHELSFIAGRNAKWYSHFRRQLGSFLQSYILTIWFCNFIPWYLSKWVKNLCPHNTLYTDVYSSFIHNCQHLEATKMPFNRWTDK